MRNKTLYICFDAGMNLGHCGFFEDHLLSYGTMPFPPQKYPNTQARLEAQHKFIKTLVKDYKDLAKEHFNASRCKIVFVTEDVTQSFANTKFKSKHNWLVVASYTLLFLVAGEVGAAVLVYSPSTIKKHFTGAGNAKKEKMKEAFSNSEYKDLVGKLDSHVIDAIAIYDTMKGQYEKSK